MTVRSRIDWLPHAILLVGIAIIAFPVYVTLVASTLTTPDIVYGPMTLIPGPHAPENYWNALTEGNAKTSGVGVDRMLLNTLIVALSIQLSLTRLFASGRKDDGPGVAGRRKVGSVRGPNALLNPVGGG